MGISVFRRVGKFIIASSLLLGLISLAPASFIKPETKADQELLGRVSRLFQDIAKKALPAVVSISTVKTVFPLHRSNYDSPFRALGPGLPGAMEEEDDESDLGEAPKALGIGTGIIIRNDGMILTSYHVIENAEFVTVTLDEKHKVRATVIGADPKTDLAILKIIPPRQVPGPISLAANLPTLSFGNSDEIKVGDWAIVVGSPFGLARSVSFGIISAKGRGQMGVLDIEDFIQTDASINPGSSGGPLLNTKGEIVGITTAIFSQSGGFTGIGFAVPSRIARDAAEQIIAKGRVSRGWVGIVAQDLNEDLAEYFHTSPETGALISRVLPEGPAGRAKLAAGDVVLKFDQETVEDSGHLRKLVEKRRAGDEVSVKLIRKRHEMTLAIKIQEEPTSSALSLGPHRRQEAGRIPPAKPASSKPSPLLGLAVEEIPREILRYLNGAVQNGVLIVGVVPGSPAFDVGLSPGDIVMKINDTEIRNTRDFAHHLRPGSPDTLTLLYIQRGVEERLFIPIRAPHSD